MECPEVVAIKNRGFRGNIFTNPEPKKAIKIICL
jgi:hypothetical protein